MTKEFVNNKEWKFCPVCGVPLHVNKKNNLVCLENHK